MRIFFFYLIRNYTFLILVIFFFFFQSLSGFLMMMTQNGKLLYISDNAAEYLGHSMVSTRRLFVINKCIIYLQLGFHGHFSYHFVIYKYKELINIKTNVWH